MFYRLHGFRVSSEQPIAGLSPVEPFVEADLEFRFGLGPFPAPLPLAQTPAAIIWFKTLDVADNGEPGLLATRAADGSYCRLAYADGMTFTVDGPASIVWIDWSAGRTIADVPGYLLGPVIGLVLRLRGITSLHASAVLVDGRAVVFAGPKGAGKSTIAAALGVRGVRVLADDTIALRRSSTSWTAAPGFPRLRLWPESAEALRAEVGSEGFLPPGVSGSSTRYHLDVLARQPHFDHESVPLGLIYLIGRVSDMNVPEVSTLAPSEAVIALVGNTYANQLLDRDLRAREFEVLSQLVEQVPVRRLTRPTAITTLSDYRDFVLDDLNACGLRSSAA